MPLPNESNAKPFQSLKAFFEAKQNEGQQPSQPLQRTKVKSAFISIEPERKSAAPSAASTIRCSAAEPPPSIPDVVDRSIAEPVVVRPPVTTDVADETTEQESKQRPEGEACPKKAEPSREPQSPARMPKEGHKKNATGTKTTTATNQPATPRKTVLGRSIVASPKVTPINAQSATKSPRSRSTPAASAAVRSIGSSSKISSKASTPIRTIKPGSSRITRTTDSSPFAKSLPTDSPLRSSRATTPRPRTSNFAAPTSASSSRTIKTPVSEQKKNTSSKKPVKNANKALPEDVPTQSIEAQIETLAVS